MFKNWVDVLFFLLSGSTAAFGNMLLKAGMNKMVDADYGLKTLIPTFLKMVSVWQIVVGFLLYGVSSVLYLKVISSAEVTRIYPLIVSYMFILLLVLGALFIKEPITITKIMGVVIIIAGIFLASK